MTTLRARVVVLLLGLAACGKVEPLPVGDGAAGGSTGTGGSTGAGGGAGGQTGAGGGGGGTVCSVACTTGRTCCGGACVNPSNDPMNCGMCGKRCGNDAPFCSGGTCTKPPCSVDGGSCSQGGSCCGSTCCAAGDLCCAIEGPVSGGPPQCITPTAAQPTCPQGCAPLCVSDRNRKKDFAPVDPAAILAKVTELPISTWTYVDEPTGVRHLGPMAQDFRASFGLGADDRTYNAVDAHGVSLAAIQALAREVRDQQQRIERLERENRELERKLRDLRR